MMQKDIYKKIVLASTCKFFIETTSEFSILFFFRIKKRRIICSFGRACIQVVTNPELEHVGDVFTKAHHEITQDKDFRLIHCPYAHTILAKMKDIINEGRLIYFY